MYRIIGADGREYGDVTADVMRKWIGEGRVNAQTRVLPEGGTEWKTLAEIPELAAMLGAPPAPMEVLPDDSYARGLVNGPAIGLIVTAVLGILSNGLSIVYQFALPQSRSYPGMPPEFEEIMNSLNGPLSLFSGVIGILSAVFILFAAIRMRQLQSYALAMAASIVAIVPCVSPCCCIGIPIGIWALVVLSKAEVKSAFN